MRAPTALPCFPVLGAVLALCGALSGCGWLAGLGPGMEPSELPRVVPHDGGEIRDISTPPDGGPLDEPEQRDAGSEDAGLHDAGESDAGIDGGAPDPEEPLPARVLASGSGIGTAATSVGTLHADDTVLLFLARERKRAALLPGRWHGAIEDETGSGERQVVGASYRFRDNPESLAGPLVIEVQPDERFAYALIAVTGLGAPKDDDKDKGDSELLEACDGGPGAHYDDKVGYDAYIVAGFAHRGPPAHVASPAQLLVAVEPELGPSLIVQELEALEDVRFQVTTCLGSPSPLVFVGYAFERD